ncbi:hypothetical protein, partial [Raoultella ornithinolytica]|uniref:hypothetical protein n=1 Tax=Raoultella ornithinolytica TaxID=54291 RepID=UPI001951F2B9
MWQSEQPLPYRTQVFRATRPGRRILAQCGFVETGDRIAAQGDSWREHDGIALQASAIREMQAPLFCIQADD